MLNLRWRDIECDAINLPDSKTGPRAVPLSAAARAQIEALPGWRKPEAFLFPRHAEGRGVYSLESCWRTVLADAKLGSLRLHDLRHTAASQAVISAKTCPWWASCSGTGVTARQQATLTSPILTLSTWRKQSEQLSPEQWRKSPTCSMSYSYVLPSDWLLVLRSSL